MIKIKTFSRLSAMLILLLSACSGVNQLPSFSSEAANTHLSAFASTGLLMNPTNLTSAVKSGSIGKYSTTAVVPLFFGSDGRLLTASKLTFLVDSQRAGKFKNFTNAATVETFFRGHGVTYRFVNFNTYKAVMNKLAAANRITLNSYAPLSSAAATRTPLSGTNAQYYVFQPYVRNTNVVQPTGSVIRQDTECSTKNQQTLLTPQELSTKIGTSQLIEAVDEFHGVDFRPQQGGNQCILNCAGVTGAWISTCFGIPFIPGTLACLAAATLYNSFCVKSCYQP